MESARRFRSSQQKISGSNGTSEKVVLFFRMENYNGNSCSISSKPFSGKWNWFEQMVNAIPGRNLPVPNFSNHSSKPWTDPRFARSKWVVYASSRKTCLESKVDSKRNSDFSGWFRWDIFRSNRFLKRWSCFSRQNVPIGNSCSQLESHVWYQF